LRTFLYIAVILGTLLNHSELFAQPERITIGWISSEHPSFPGTPTYLERSDDDGLAGAELAIAEANKTGRFLGYQLALAPVALEQFTGQYDFVLLNLHEADAKQHFARLASKYPTTTFINIRSQHNDWRAQQCLANMLHTIPSFAMQSDALGQWMLQQRLKHILVVHGDHPADMAYVESVARMAKRFKFSIIAQKAWTGEFDLRRVAYREVPQFTKTTQPYDVVFVADYQRQFGYALQYNNALHAPVIGDFGLQAVTWHPTIEQWGARQLQNRFIETNARSMTSVDFTSYLGVKAVAYAAQSTRATQRDVIDAALRSSDFALAAYKGRKLNFRQPNGQLRMPIALAHDAGLLTNAPLEGFLHPVTDLDTLGFDTHERCQ
jgi:ABC transporter substrate binding protein (PQQ-dependent alcohol dehydrogenase system)